MLETINWVLKLFLNEGHQIGVMTPNERHGICAGEELHMPLQGHPVYTQK